MNDFSSIIISHIFRGEDGTVLFQGNDEHCSGVADLARKFADEFGVGDGADPDFFDSNGPWRGYKRDVYEGGIRVPFIVQWNGHVAKGQESDFLCSFWDVMPTLRELNGQKIEDEMDGISLLPMLEGRKKGQKEHDFLYFEFQEMGGRQAVRQGPWKLVHLNIRNDRECYELYNLDEDPSETENLIESNPAIAESLKSIMVESHIPNPDFPVLRGE